MLATQGVVAFVATTDAARARTFYADVLGLQFVADEPYALVFTAHGTTLRIQKLERFTPQAFTVLGFDVADLDACVVELGQHGVPLQRYAGLEQEPSGVWRSPSGARIAWFKDPDGNTLSLTQLR